MKPKKTSKTTNPKGKKVTREVDINLNKETYAKFGEEEGECMRNVSELKKDFSDVKAKWEARIDPIEDRLSFIRDSLKNGKERKTVECIQVKNFDEGRMEWYYNGEVVDHRPLTELDHQEELGIKTKKGRTRENSVVTPEPTEDENISNVRRMETSRRTKTSAVDGPTGRFDVPEEINQ